METKHMETNHRVFQFIRALLVAVAALGSSAAFAVDKIYSCDRTNPAITELTIGDQDLEALRLFYQTDQDFREMMRAAPSVTDITKMLKPPPLTESEKKSAAKRRLMCGSKCN